MPTTTPVHPKKKQVQPKTHAGKSKQATKLRRKKILNSILNGKTQQQAGIEAGLSPKTAPAQVTAILKEPETRATFFDLLHKAVPDDFHANTFRECMEATKVISANIIAKGGEGMADAHSMTKDFIDVPDYAVRRASAVDVAKLKGYTDDNPINTGPINIMIVYDKKDRLGMEDA